MSTEKFALITGGGVGIGKATALALAGAGWHVAVTGRRLEPLTETARAVEALGRRALAHSCDVGDPASVASLLRFSPTLGSGSVDSHETQPRPGTSLAYHPYSLHSSSPGHSPVHGRSPPALATAASNTAYMASLGPFA